MRVRVIPVLMHGGDVVKVTAFTLKEPLANLARNICDILAARANREGHKEVRGMPQLGMEPLIPLR